MRGKRTRLGMMAACAALALVSVSARAMVDINDVVRQVDIMARVLETRLQEELGGDLVTGGIFERGGVRGAWVPGVGVVFQAKVKFPLAERKPARKPDQPEPDDLWSRIERGEKGLAGGGGGYGFFTRPRDSSGEPLAYRVHVSPDSDEFLLLSGEAGVELSSSDRRKIQKLEETVVETIAKYAERLTHFGPDDNIVVLVSGSHGFDSRRPSFVNFETVPKGWATLLEHKDDVTKGDVADFQREIDRMQKDLAEILKKMKSSRNAEELKALAEDYAKRLQDHRERVEAQKGVQEALKEAAKTRFVTTPIATPGGPPATSWVLKVRKGDCLESEKELWKKAEIVAY